MAEATNSRRVVPVIEVLEKIQKGEPVEYDDVIIEGDLDLTKLDLPTQPQRKCDTQEIAKLVVSPIKITNAEIGGNLNFTGTFFQESIIFSKSRFDGSVDFIRTTFDKDAEFDGSTFNKFTDFMRTMFSRNADFNEATFDEHAEFMKTTFTDFASFVGATFNNDADFCEATFSDIAILVGATFNGRAEFIETKFDSYVYFTGATFNNDAVFHKTIFSDKTYFDGAKFSHTVDFSRAKFDGNFITFRETIFVLPESQEDACRVAKNAHAKGGNRDEEEYHFYREMEAKRKQKLTGYEDFDYEALLFNTDLSQEGLNSKRWGFVNYLSNMAEYIFIQKIFGYGVHPFWLFGWWLIFVATFTAIYWMGGAVGIPEMNGEINQSSSLADYVWFSIATAATPGYALYKPLGNFKLVAGIEAIIGTFMWAAFITTFAKKFMR